ALVEATVEPLHFCAHNLKPRHQWLTVLRSWPFFAKLSPECTTDLRNEFLGLFGNRLLLADKAIDRLVSDDGLRDLDIGYFHRKAPSILFLGVAPSISPVRSSTSCSNFMIARYSFVRMKRVRSVRSG